MLVSELKKLLENVPDNHEVMLNFPDKNNQNEKFRELLHVNRMAHTIFLVADICSPFENQN